MFLGDCEDAPEHKIVLLGKIQNNLKVFRKVDLPKIMKGFSHHGALNFYNFSVKHISETNRLR